MAKGKKKTKFIPLDQIDKIEKKTTEEKKNIVKENVESTSVSLTPSKDEEKSVSDTNMKKSNSNNNNSNNNNNNNNNNNKEKKNKKQTVVKDEKEDFSTCIICTEDVKVYSLGICNHPLCHICSLRLRLLYNSKECPYCKTELENVIFTKNDKRLYEEYNISKDFIYKNEEKKFYYETEEIKKVIESVEKYSCPDKNCDFVGEDLASLKKHVEDKHKKFLCDICSKKKKVFPFEQKLYAKKELERHKTGDPDNIGAKGHPECGFCRIRYYDDDELYDHCRKNHEECQVCKRNGNPNQYFINYRELADHFEKEHYVCPYPECLEKKFIVFGSEVELKTHIAEEHNRNKGKKGFIPIDLDLNYVDSYGTSMSDRFNRNRGDRNRNDRNDRNRNDRNDRNRNDRNDRNNRNNRHNKNDRNDRNERNNRNNRNERYRNENEEQVNKEENEGESSTTSNNRSRNNERRPRRRFNVPEGFGSKLTNSENEVSKSEDEHHDNEINDSTPSSSNQHEHEHGHTSTSTPHNTTVTITSNDREEIELITKLNEMIGTDPKNVQTFQTISSSYYKDLINANIFLEAFINLIEKNESKGKGKGKKKNMTDKIGRVWNLLAENLKKKKDTPEGKTIDFEKKCNDMLSAWNDYKIKQNNNEEDYSSILAEKKKKLTKSYASHADMPDGFSMKPRTKAKVLVIKPSTSTPSSPSLQRTYSQDNDFFERIAAKTIQREKISEVKSKMNQSSSSSDDDEESSSSSANEMNHNINNNTNNNNNNTNNNNNNNNNNNDNNIMTSSRSSSPILNVHTPEESDNRPSSKTVIENARKYMNSTKHKINKYNAEFPSLAGSSTSTAAILAASSASSSYTTRNKNKTNPYDRKTNFQSMSQKLKSQEEFPSLQSSNRSKKQNNQIKQPRNKGGVLRIV